MKRRAFIAGLLTLPFAAKATHGVVAAEGLGGLYPHQVKAILDFETGFDWKHSYAVVHHQGKTRLVKWAHS